MQNLLDTRILKKTIKYLFIWLGGIIGVIATFVILLGLSYRYFDSAVPFFILLFGSSMLVITYMMAKDAVDQERRDEQRLVDDLIRSAKREEEYRALEVKYGVKLSH